MASTALPATGRGGLRAGCGWREAEKQKAKERGRPQNSAASWIGGRGRVPGRGAPPVLWPLNVRILLLLPALQAPQGQVVPEARWRALALPRAGIRGWISQIRFCFSNKAAAWPVGDQCRQRRGGAAPSVPTQRCAGERVSAQSPAAP